MRTRSLLFEEPIGALLGDVTFWDLRNRSYLVHRWGHSKVKVTKLLENQQVSIVLLKHNARWLERFRINPRKSLFKGWQIMTSGVQYKRPWYPPVGFGGNITVFRDFSSYLLLTVHWYLANIQVYPADIIWYSTRICQKSNWNLLNVLMIAVWYTSDIRLWYPWNPDIWCTDFQQRFTPWISSWNLPDMKVLASSIAFCLTILGLTQCLAKFLLSLNNKASSPLSADERSRKASMHATANAMTSMLARRSGHLTRAFRA